MAASFSSKHTERVDARIEGLAARQHGLITRAQALRFGATPSMIRWRVRIQRWHVVHPNTYRIAGSPQTWHQRAMAACLYLGPPTTLSFRAAAALAGADGFKRSRLEVTVTQHRNRSGKHRLIIHIPEEPIPEEDITTIDGIRVTKPARTLLDLATVEPEAVVARCLDDALRRRLVSIPFLERWLDDPRRRGHRGSRLLRRLVVERAVRGVTGSPQESTFLQLVVERGLPTPALQYVVKDGETFVGRVDFAYPAKRVAIEVDGFRHHDTRSTFDAERARGNALGALGWLVLRVTAAHLDRDPDAVIRWVERALGLT